MKIRYFAWIRERLNRSDEEVDLPPEVRTVSDLLDFLGKKDEAARLVFEDRSTIRAALDGDLVPLDASLNQRSAVALFPPMTGG